MSRLSGKIAIVTGAASGIGAASAKLFADEGAQVLAVDRAGIGNRRRRMPAMTRSRPVGCRYHRR